MLHPRVTRFDPFLMTAKHRRPHVNVRQSHACCIIHNEFSILRHFDFYSIQFISIPKKKKILTASTVSLWAVSRYRRVISFSDHFDFFCFAFDRWIRFGEFLFLVEFLSLALVESNPESDRHRRCDAQYYFFWFVPSFALVSFQIM